MSVNLQKQTKNVHHVSIDCLATRVIRPPFQEMQRKISSPLHNNDIMFITPCEKTCLSPHVKKKKHGISSVSI